MMQITLYRLEQTYWDIEKLVRIPKNRQTIGQKSSKIGPNFLSKRVYWQIVNLKWPNMTKIAQNHQKLAHICCQNVFYWKIVKKNVAENDRNWPKSAKIGPNFLL